MPNLPPGPHAVTVRAWDSADNVGAAALTVVGTLAMSAPAYAGGRPFSTVLTGAAEVPGPGDLDATGSASLTLTQGQGEVCFELSWAGIDGTVVAESSGGEIVAPLDAFSHDVFLLDLEAGRNRYVMTRTDDLAPLLSLPPARLERDGSRLRNVGDVAALGVVAEDDVLDLLPGEEREAGDVRDPGWNARL